MNFDTVIIGGGLAGLTCAIALQQAGKQCTIINNGQAAIDFASGSMDLLSRLPNGENVANLNRAYAQLSTQAPQHPYSILGLAQVQKQAQQFEQIAQQLNLGVRGSSEQNHWRVTPLGGLRASWLSPISVPTLSLEEKFPHQSIAILGIEGYHDFQPQLLADNLKQQPQFSHCHIFTNFLRIEQLDQLRQQSREFRSVNISQLLEHKLAFQSLVEEICAAAQGASAVFLPACFGAETAEFFTALRQATRLDLFELPTLPPSLLGMRQHHLLKNRFQQLGGLMMNGDKVLRAELEHQRVKCVYTRLHQEQPISAQHFVLASGSFFSQGLVADFDHIYEPIFHLDLVQTENFNPQDRHSWTVSRFSQPQPYQSAGVRINARCQVQKRGEIIENLYAVGNVIGGFNGIELGCASGVAVVSALTAAEDILGGGK